MVKPCGLTCVLGLKGGVGKTSLVLALYHYFTEQGLDVGVLSNDRISRTMGNIVRDAFLRITANADFPAVETTDNLLFDFGGFPERRAHDLIGKAKNILLPTLGDSLSIEGCDESLRQIEPLALGARIAVIGNRVTDDELDLLKDLFDVPVFRFKNSAGVPNMFSSKKSLKQQIADRKVLRNLYSGIVGDVKTIGTWLGNSKEDDETEAQEE